MLTILRKHASTWITKAILGLIAVVFIFFFGSGTLRKSQNHPSAVVAKVNGEPITVAYLQGQILEKQESNEMYKNLPESFEQKFRSMVLNGIINEKILVTEAEKIGLAVSNAELADAIQKTPQAQKDGKFDSVFYQSRFRPWFANRYAIDYEEWLKNALTKAKLFQYFSNMVVVSDNEVKSHFASENTRFKFKKVSLQFMPLAEKNIPDEKEIQAWIDQKKSSTKETLPPDDILKQEAVQELNKKTGHAKADSLAQEMLPLWKGSGNVASFVKKNELLEDETDSVNLNEMQRAFPGIRPDDIQKLAGLSPEKPILDSIIDTGDAIYLVKLVEKKQADWTEFETKKQEEIQKLKEERVASIFDQWFEEKKKSAKIKIVEST